MIRTPNHRELNEWLKTQTENKFAQSLVEWYAKNNRFTEKQFVKARQWYDKVYAKWKLEDDIANGRCLNHRFDLVKESGYDTPQLGTWSRTRWYKCESCGEEKQTYECNNRSGD